MDPYHFVNFPKDANAYNQQRDCKLRNCVIEVIAWYLQVLKSPDPPRNGARGIITDAEFKQKLLEERAVYRRILNPTAQ